MARDESAIEDRRDRVCIVGAGPAGLCQARAFRRAGIPYDQYERHDSLGGIWDLENPGTPMYETASFISSKTLSAFGGFPMPDHYPDYPSRAQVLDYLRAFAAAHELEPGITFGQAVSAARPEGEAWLVTLGSGARRRYGGLVCGNGMTWDPVLPAIAGHFAGELRHAVTYRGPAELAGKRVLVVGGGNSGCDIACDAAESAAVATLSLRRGYHIVPKHILGLPADIFGQRFRALPLRLRQVFFALLLRLLAGSPRRLGWPAPDHRVLESHPILNTRILGLLKDRRLTVKPDLAGFEGRQALFADGSRLELDLVLLATGYGKSVPYLADGLLDRAAGRLKGYVTVFHRSHPTLFTLGFIETNAGIFADLDRLAGFVAQHLRDRAAAPARAARLRDRVLGERPDLSGGIRYVTSPRHAAYLDHAAFRAYLARLEREMGWPAI